MTGPAAPPKSFHLSPEVHAYLMEHSSPIDPVLRELAEETRKLGPISMMQVAPEQGHLLTLLARLLGARRAVEVGTFTGYSAISMARALPEDGRLVSCDIDPKAHEIARAHLVEAGLSERVDLRLGPALDTLEELAADGARFDMVFLDADKASYCAYLELAVPMIPAGGLLVADNTLWSGRVLRPETEAARGIAAFNDTVMGHPDLEPVLLTVRDGMTLARKIR